MHCDCRTWAILGLPIAGLPLADLWMADLPLAVLPMVGLPMVPMAGLPTGRSLSMPPLRQCPACPPAIGSGSSLLPGIGPDLSTPWQSMAWPWQPARTACLSVAGLSVAAARRRCPASPAVCKAPGLAAAVAVWRSALDCDCAMPSCLSPGSVFGSKRRLATCATFLHASLTNREGNAQQLGLARMTRLG